MKNYFFESCIVSKLPLSKLPCLAKEVLIILNSHFIEPN